MANPHAKSSRRYRGKNMELRGEPSGEGSLCTSKKMWSFSFGRWAIKAEHLRLYRFSEELPYRKDVVIITISASVGSLKGLASH